MVGQLMKSVTLSCSFTGYAKWSTTSLSSGGQIKTLVLPSSVVDQESFNTWFRENFAEEVNKYCQDLSYIKNLSKRYDRCARDGNDRYTGLRDHSLRIKVDFHAEQIPPYVIGALVGPYKGAVGMVKKKGWSRNMDELLEDMAEKIQEYAVYFQEKDMPATDIAVNKILQKQPEIRSKADLEKFNEENQCGLTEKQIQGVYLPIKITKRSVCPPTKTEGSVRLPVATQTKGEGPLTT